jgi:hypothetical protein
MLTALLVAPHILEVFGLIYFARIITKVATKSPLSQWFW